MEKMMNLNRLCAFETMCFDTEGAVGGYGCCVENKQRERDTSEFSRQFYNAAVDEYNRSLGAAGVASLSSRMKDLAFAESKLKILQKWIDQGRDLTGLDVGAWDLKFRT